MDWIVDVIEQERDLIVEGVSESRESIILKIKRMQAMDEMLYDDKLAGEISKAKYEVKNKAFTEETEQMRKKLDGIEDDVAEKFDEAISIIKLTQTAR